MTEKLYYKDAYTEEFEARVISFEYQEPYYVTVLDKTAFFPEEGGQSADTGTLGDARVLDVRERRGVIYHYLDKEPTLGDTVHGRIDFPVRYDKMKQHTAEHILSGYFHSCFGLSNVGFHLGECEVTLDIDGVLTWDELKSVEALANSAVTRCIPVVAYFPSPEELKTLEYRSKLDLTEGVRIVKIEGVDTCACCAPHVKNTGEIGTVKIVSAERWRGGMRLVMHAGERALRDYERKLSAVAAISKELSAPQDGVYDAVVKLKGDFEELKHSLAQKDRRIAELFAEGVRESAGNAVVLLPDMSSDGLIAFSNLALPKIGGVLVALTGEEGSYKYVISSRSADLRARAKEINSALLGRGGGRPEMIQGSFAATLRDIQEYFK